MRILIADPDEKKRNAALLAVQSLIDDELVVHHATDAMETLSLAGVTRFDMIVLGERLPDMTAQALTESLRARNCKAFVLVAAPDTSIINATIRPLLEIRGFKVRPPKGDTT